MPRPTGYSFLITGETLQFVRTLRASEQRALDSTFQFLVDHPHHAGDYQEHGESGRLMEVLLRGRFAVTFWTDHAVKEVRIVRIEEA